MRNLKKIKELLECYEITNVEKIWEKGEKVIALGFDEKAKKFVVLEQARWGQSCTMCDSYEEAQYQFYFTICNTERLTHYITYL